MSRKAQADWIIVLSSRILCPLASVCRPARPVHHRPHLQRARSAGGSRRRRLCRVREAEASTASSSSSTTTRRTAPGRSLTTSRAASDHGHPSPRQARARHGGHRRVRGGAGADRRRHRRRPQPSARSAPRACCAVMQRTSADVVIGSRYIPGGGTRNWPLGRLRACRASPASLAPADAGARRDVGPLPDPARPGARA